MATLRTLLAGLVVATSAAGAAPLDDACVRVARNLNSLIDDFDTSCVLSGVGRPAGPTFLLVAGTPVSRRDRAWRAFMVFGCMAAGERMNATRDLGLRRVWFTDTDLLRENAAYSIDASVCQRLQAATKKGSTSLEAAADEVQQRASRLTTR